jgi:hypothetical protein
LFLIDINKVRIQILCRNTTYKGAHDKAFAMFNLLDKKNDILELVAGGADVMAVSAMQTPTGVGQDQKERYVYTCNYLFTIRGNNL